MTIKRINKLNSIIWKICTKIYTISQEIQVKSNHHMVNISAIRTEQSKKKNRYIYVVQQPKRINSLTYCNEDKQLAIVRNRFQSQNNPFMSSPLINKGSYWHELNGSTIIKHQTHALDQYSNQHHLYYHCSIGSNPFKRPLSACEIQYTQANRHSLPKKGNFFHYFHVQPIFFSSIEQWTPHSHPKHFLFSTQRKTWVK